MPIFKSLGFAILLITLVTAMPEVFNALEDTFIVALETIQEVLSSAQNMAGAGAPIIPNSN